MADSSACTLLTLKNNKQFFSDAFERMARAVQMTIFFSNAQQDPYKQQNFFARTARAVQTATIFSNAPQEMFEQQEYFLNACQGPFEPRPNPFERLTNGY